MALSGRPLRYRIGAEDAPDQPGFQVEAPYGIAPPSGGIWYCNLYDQTGTGAYGPYLPDTETSAQYGEKVVDPNGPGWAKLIEAELAAIPIFGTVEWDNIDGYPINAVLDAYSRTGQRGITVIAKNPGILKSGAGLYAVSHPTVVGIIVEKDAGGAPEMDALRKAAGKPDLPVRFVAFGDGRAWAESIAASIKAHGYSDMGVTYDAAGEYGGDITDILLPTQGTSMPNTQPAAVSGADILARAESYKGKFHDGPDVVMMANAIAAKFPDLAAYSRGATNTMPWCADFISYVLIQFGIKPPYDPADPYKCFFWASAFTLNKAWGGTAIPRAQAQPGDIVVLNGGGIHHVTFFKKDLGNGRFVGVGGNQSDAVTEATFNWANLEGVVRPPLTGVIQQPAPVIPVIAKPAGQFDKSVAYVLIDEGGNDDDPRDPGGRTSRGITQREWDVWRQTHAGLPSDVWQAPQDQVIAIYRQNYWNALQCDSLPAGVDYAMFDFGVNSGIGKATVLQGIVGTEQDGEIGPLTIAATQAMDPATVIKALCDQRMAILRGLKTWPTYGHGWTNRVEGHVRPQALAMVGTTLPPIVIPPPISPIPTGQPIPSMAELIARVDLIATEMKAMNDRLAALEKSKMPDTTVPAPPTTAPAPIDVGAALARIEKLLAARPDTTSQSYVALKTLISSLPNIGAYGSILAYGVLWAMQALKLVGTAGILGTVGATPTGSIATAGILTTLATSLLALFTKKPATS